MSEDHELLRRYVDDGSDAAFTELVQRRLGLVYSVALRQTGGDSHRAQDVAQQVFHDLARKAPTLVQRPVLLGWLYRSTHYAARQAVRTEIRRRQREQAAEFMAEPPPAPAPIPDWEKLRPTLDQVLDELDERDRDAVLLRFFDHRPYAEIGQCLQLSENAARMRVERALAKLQGLLSRRGITSTGAALGLALGAQAAVVVPNGLFVAISSTALAGAATGAAAGTGASVLFMTSLKAQFGLTAALAAVGTSGWLWQSHEQETLRAELASRSAAAQAAAPDAREPAARLSQSAAEAERLRRVDREYAALREQIDTLRHLQQRAENTPPASVALAAPRAYNTVYPIHQLDQPPVPQRQGPPVYPAELRVNGVEGEAVIAFTVEADGVVYDPEVVSATHPEFGAAALAAVQQWGFAPGARAGGPVATRLQVPIKFAVTPGGAREPGPNNWF